MTKKTANLEAIKQYMKCKPRQFGNMHERMKYLVQVMCELRAETPKEVWHAAWDLLTEVRNHIPEEPPFGARPPIPGPHRVNEFAGIDFDKPATRKAYELKRAKQREALNARRNPIQPTEG